MANLNRRDQGRYRCQVNNVAGGPAASQEAQLTVNYGIKIFLNPQPKSRIEGGSVTFTCEVEGKPPPEVTWLKDGNLFTIEAIRMKVTQPTVHHRTPVSLTINELIRTDEGSYNCRVNNFLDERTSTPAFLAVYYSPVIFQNPLNLTKREGDSMVMSCGVDGNPVPEVTWKKDVVTLVHGDRINITKPSSVGRVYSTLTISNLVVGDKGTYKCMVNNTLNAVVSIPGSLTIISLDLWFVNPETNFTVTAGQNVTLVCEVWGVSPDITWYRDGKSMEAT
ncbi:peroxidasin homolog, partial [Actinia tenebrosa]|uniref:Peroxidasin homolog n=1 Tax=Actinia tenebrosa TaxID=6105 RepID=A0A6P8HXX3_ACTTE